MEITIYLIKCPLTNKIKYVGKTVNLKRRYYQHTCKSGRFKNRHLSNWINKLYTEYNLKPIFEVIDKCTEEDWQQRETFWIDFYSSKNKLCNHTKGGEGCHGRKMSDSLKSKISRAHKGKKKNYKCVGGVKKHTEESKNKISLSKIGKLKKGKEIQLTAIDNSVKYFKSLKQASELTGCSVTAISNNLKKQSKKTKIGIWNYKII